MQRGSVLVLTLLIISIEAGPYVNSTYTRLAFNKVGKAGGSTLTSILGHLARNNGLTIVRPKRFNPSADELATALKVLRSGHVYSNHAGHLRMNVSNLAWINIVREPIDREQSLYYYFIDPLARKVHKANASLVARQRDTRCGCAGLEFDQCVRLRHTRGCVLGCTSGQMRAFCEPKSACSFAEAMVMLEDYVFVGLMEEYELTIHIIEVLLPQFFSGASAYYKNMGLHRPKRGVSANPVTHTSGLGAVSRTSREILLNTPSCAQEAKFYTLAKRRFWLTAAHVLGESLVEVASNSLK